MTREVRNDLLRKIGSRIKFTLMMELNYDKIKAIWSVEAKIVATHG